MDDAEFLSMMDDAHMNHDDHIDQTMMAGDDGVMPSSHSTSSMDMGTEPMTMTFFTGKNFYLLFDSLHVVSNTDFILVIYFKPVLFLKLRWFHSPTSCLWLSFRPFSGRLFLAS